MMNILFISLLDFDSLDERNIYTDLLRTFLKHGHYVCVVSPVERRKHKRALQLESENLLILKPKIGNTQKTNLIEKGISILRLESRLKQSIKKFTTHIKFDLIIYTTPPITFYKAVKYVKKRDNAKTYLLLKDIFPQNAVDLGILSKKGLKGVVYKHFRHKEKRLYRVSDYIGCLSPANIRFLLRHNQENVSKSIEVCPNSIEPQYIVPRDKGLLKRQFDIPEESTAFIYGGNLGKPQNIDFIILCLKKNINMDDRYFIICGTGTDYYKLEEFFSKEKPRNMRLINGLPKEKYDELVSSCDVGLIFLDCRFTIPNFPSRLLSYMDYSMPTLACTDINTDLGEIMEKGSFGWWCESNDEEMFLEKINYICEHKNEIEKFGLNAREYLEKNYTSERSYQIIMKHFTNSVL
ncbi:Glycosyltransferase involved in cell wall bisynthesis [Paenibacillus sp. UNCCL117]|uniref:glycosyltransferase family 4 protein n=1 Tax=unclassified Paenibacillus TaxID=185978 RepID=UPI00088BBC5E|nr:MULTISPECIES: glycosyltransferase family 4 protein [unclassified Paenibacillus]SDC04211.1 Glycosyltransferase involved in cell wall bisynthesis [Paenibacillus sp. cl123]SFW37270.1 Glycosyltransferase involved in cell wall bisynthesis [Paenibacillus sp. UNCCL117]